MLFQQKERERERERITIIKSKYLCITLCNKAIFKLINFAIQTQCFVRRAFSPRAKGEARRGSIVYYRRGEAISEWRDVATERRQATWRGDRRHLFNFFKRSDLIIKSQHQVFFWVFLQTFREMLLFSLLRDLRSSSSLVATPLRVRTRPSFFFFVAVVQLMYVVPLHFFLFFFSSLYSVFQLEGVDQCSVFGGQ